MFKQAFIRVWIFYFILFSCEIALRISLSAETIHIITEPTGSNRDVDFKILEDELKKLGHKIGFVNVNNKISTTWWSKNFDQIEFVDTNIFIETINPALLQFAIQNYLIPSPKNNYDLNILKKFDIILCRTDQEKRIFDALNLMTYFLGFTSFDRYVCRVRKDFNKYIHITGLSPFKGTKTVLDVWSKHPEFPPLINIAKTPLCIPYLPNVKFSNGFIPDEELKVLQNSCGIHICTSEIEGYCHTLMEGMSAGSIVVTTNGPPMNAFVYDKRCLVECKSIAQLNFGTCYYIDPVSLENVISNLRSLPQEELVKIGQINRQVYLLEREIFRERLRRLFGRANN